MKDQFTKRRPSWIFVFLGLLLLSLIVYMVLYSDQIARESDREYEMQREALDSQDDGDALSFKEVRPVDEAYF